MPRIAPLVAGILALASPVLAQSDRPTSTRPAEELYVQLCQMCHMPDGNAAIKDMNFADGEWKHGTVIKQQAKVGNKPLKSSGPLSSPTPGEPRTVVATRVSESRDFRLDETPAHR